MINLENELLRLRRDAEIRDLRVEKLSKICAEQVAQAHQERLSGLEAAGKMCQESERYMEIIQKASEQIALERAKLQTQLSQEIFKRVGLEHQLHVERTQFARKMEETQCLWEEEFNFYKKSVQMNVHLLEKEKKSAVDRCNNLDKLTAVLRDRVATVESVNQKKDEEILKLKALVAQKDSQLVKLTDERDNLSSLLKLEKQAIVHDPLQNHVSLLQSVMSLLRELEQQKREEETQNEQQQQQILMLQQEQLELLQQREEQHVNEETLEISPTTQIDDQQKAAFIKSHSNSNTGDRDAEIHHDAEKRSLPEALLDLAWLLSTPRRKNDKV